MGIESKQLILERRKEIEQELLDMLKETQSDFGLEDIKQIIYDEEDQDDLIHPHTKYVLRLRFKK